MTPEELLLPPTEAEICEAICLMQQSGCVKDAEVMRRLAFQRDRLTAENAALKAELAAWAHRADERARTG